MAKKSSSRRTAYGAAVKAGVKAGMGARRKAGGAERAPMTPAYRPPGRSRGKKTVGGDVVHVKAPGSSKKLQSTKGLAGVAKRRGRKRN